ncbi:MAG TPA: phosphonate C-P lyase system protein PhnL [Xanthobacteraceae bacterium]|nr:phosphonate C-P lyase system protein PhnL [Xanthobacteraceae bacterium]
MSFSATPVLELRNAAKSFTMHLQGSLNLPVVSGVEFSVAPGQCVVLAGPSGAGKSSILKIIFGNYRCDAGEIRVRDGEHVIDVAQAEPRRILALRRTVMGYVSQFLRAVPRVAALDVVAEAAGAKSLEREAARANAAALLQRLCIPERLWQVPPATFSGGEQQRVNIARGFLDYRPLLLLDEPTASLDAANRATVVELIEEKKRRGTAIVAIVHDDEVRRAIADVEIDVTRFAPAA